MKFRPKSFWRSFNDWEWRGRSGSIKRRRSIRGKCAARGGGGSEETETGEQKLPRFKFELVRVLAAREVGVGRDSVLCHVETFDLFFFIDAHAHDDLDEAEDDE